MRPTQTEPASAITHHESRITPPPQPESTPATPLDPAQEAYNRWFQMNRGAEPFDPEVLEKLYAAIPPATPKPGE